MNQNNNEPTLSNDPDERLRMLVAGRKAEQLREAKTFDSPRLVKSELFDGRGGPQADLFSKTEDADERFPCGHINLDEDGDCVECGVNPEEEADLDDFEDRLADMKRGAK